MAVLPAVEGVDWAKSVNAGGRMSYFCLECDPKSSGDGYYDIGSMNRHLRAKHKNRAFSTRKPRVSGERARGTHARAKSGLRARKGRGCSPAKQSCEQAGSEQAPARLLRKRSSRVKKASEPLKKRTRNQKGNIESDYNPIEGQKKVREGSREELTEDKAPAALADYHNIPALAVSQGVDYISIPICGLSSISFKVEATSSNISQTFEANSVDKSAATDAFNDRAGQCNSEQDRGHNGTVDPPLSKGSWSTARSANMIIDHCARFPIFGKNR